MFASVEKYSGPAKILLGLIAIMFVGFGVSTVSTPGSDFIIKVGDQKISQNDVNQTIQKVQIQEGQVPSRDAVFNGLLQRAYLIQGAKDMDITVSLKQLKQIIVDDPNFHDENGQFSQNLLNQYLNQRRISEDQFVEDIRQQFALQNLINLVQNGTLVSDAQANQLINLLQSVRTVRSITFNPQSFISQVKASDEQLLKYYQSNQKNYIIPEAVKLEYVALNLHDLANKQNVTDKELQSAFEQEIQSIQPKREIAHILFQVAKDASDTERAKVKAEVEKVLAEVKSHPKEFAQLAKKYSQDSGSAQNGGYLGYFAQDGSLVKPFEDVVFSLQKGQISDLVQTDFGFHIITVLNVQDKSSLEQEKNRLETEIKQKKAAVQFNQIKESLAEAAFNHSNGLQEAAKVASVSVNAPDEWLTRDTAKNMGMPEQLINAIFSTDVMQKKHNSEPINIDENTVWVVRAKEVRAKSTQTFSEAKNQVRQDYVTSEAKKLAEAKAKQSLTELNANKNPQLAWSPVTDISAEQARRALPPTAYRQLLQAKPSKDKPAYVLLEDLPAPVLMEVQSVKAPQDNEEQLPMARQILAQTQVNGVFDGLLGYLQKNIQQKQGAQKLSNSE